MVVPLVFLVLPLSVLFAEVNLGGGSVAGSGALPVVIASGGGQALATWGSHRSVNLSIV